MVGFAQLTRSIFTMEYAVRAAIALAVSILLSACAGQPQEQVENALEALSDRVSCTEPRPAVCTLEYAPTCGYDAGDVGKDYASPCNACADAAVIAYSHGACDE